MKVAVIVPVLDEATLLPTLVPRLRALAPACELVVVDGGSTDGTRQALSLAARAASFRVIDAPRGRASQMNEGARATSAPCLLFLHADTVLPDGALAAVERTMEGDAVAGSFKLRIASTDPRLWLAAGFINLRSAMMPSATGDQAIFVRRSAFDRVGGYEEIALCEDLDLISRLRRLGPIALVNAVVETSARRWQEHGVSRTIALMWAIRIGCHLGVDPERLRRFYADAR